MKKFAKILVEKRLFFFIASIAIALIFACLIGSVTVNKDQTKYLAKDSEMRKGLEIINSEFPAVELKDTVQVMFENLTYTEKVTIYEKLKTYSGVESVDYDINSTDHNTKSYTMYMVTTEYIMDSEKVNSVIDSIKADLGDEYVIHTYYANGYLDVLDLLIPLAVSIMLILLLLMCKSYFEPVLLLISIGVAVLINMGSNIIFESVSDMTFAIAAVFQLVLSIDYSIILMHRYQQEYDLLEVKDKKQAMINAIANAISSIISSSATTIVGLLVLLLMTFTIGTDIGLVLSKGVLLSLICVFTVMPSMILWFEDLIHKTDKTYLKNKRLATKNGGEANV